nr:unnamed protein product [Digitaria exilis]
MSVRSPDGGVRPIAANCSRCRDGRDTERHSQSGLPTIRPEGSGFAGRSLCADVGCPGWERIAESWRHGGEDRPSSATDRRLMTTSPCGTTVSGRTTTILGRPGAGSLGGAR